MLKIAGISPNSFQYNVSAVKILYNSAIRKIYLIQGDTSRDYHGRTNVDKLKISANGPLNGEITVSGAKKCSFTADVCRLADIRYAPPEKTSQCWLMSKPRKNCFKGWAHAF